MAPETIFKATYSGVPVYEMICKGVAVMRRRSDAWLNATQILKVAGFDKPQRTRVLERDVQKAEHEKVQGGYGKYQGTWVPLERGLELAKQYNIEHLLRPIIDFQPSMDSPPLAPKHVTAAPNKAKKPNGDGSAIATRGTRRQQRASTDSRASTPHDDSADDSMSSSPPSRASSASRTPSPIGPSDYASGGEDSKAGLSTRQSARKRKATTTANDHSSRGNRGGHASNAVNTDPSRYADTLLEYFISDSGSVPDLLVHPPYDFDPNLILDDDGHTPLHWACAMGRTRVVKLLLTAGADIYKANKQGQTPLMRSVMFANNYEVRKFPELFETLRRSILNLDNANRTVFHHIVDVAMGKGKPHAARYYLETILSRFAEHPQELADILNFQDEDGETALTMAARCRSKRLVKLLLDNGADPKIRNRDGKNCEDYVLEDERFRGSPGSRNIPLAGPSSTTLPSRTYNSDIARRAGGQAIADMASLMESLAIKYDQELSDKDRDIAQARHVLEEMQAEIADAQKVTGPMSEKVEMLEARKVRLKELEEEMLRRLHEDVRGRWVKWFAVETGEVPPPSTGEGGDEPAVVANGNANGDGMDVSVPEHSVDSMTPEQIAAECDALREEIESNQRRRKDALEVFVREQADAGTGGRMQDYRRLIAVAMGGAAPSEVDGVLPLLVEMFEAEQLLPVGTAPPVGLVSS